ncbi:histidine kinase dimerization/phospho-acceptor domain-containing protein, partial [Ornithobacterium rhinotracheale]
MKKSQKIAFSSFFAMVLSGLVYCMAGSPLILSALVLILVFIGIYFSLNYAEKPNSNHLNIAVNTSPDLPEKTNELDTFYERENYRREFVGNVAHELKTPLFSIQGYLLTLIEGGVDDE